MSKSNLFKKATRSTSGVPVKKTAVTRKAQTNKLIDVDHMIAKMAKRGDLAQAGKNAFKRSLKKGLSVTVAEDGAIYRIHPNGTRTRIKEKRVMYRDSKTGRFYQK